MDLVVNLNKPQNITSHDAVTRVKRIFKAKKAGHAGTLDPMATGVLLVCVNKATRLAQYFSSLDKEYDAVLKLGETTDTQDAQGKIIAQCDNIDINKDQLEDIFSLFIGKISQKPPMYSAIKHKGKPLYKLARKGIEIDRKPKEITIRRLEISEINMPFVHFKTVCSKGTYIRTLCNDIGDKLGIGAHLSELKRIAIGPYKLSESMMIEDLQSHKQGITKSHGIFTMDKALPWMPELTVNNSMMRNVRNGVSLNPNDISDFSDEMKSAEGVRIKTSDDHLLAIASYSKDKNVLQMNVVFNS